MKKLLYAIIAIIALVSCQEDDMIRNTPNNDGEKVTLNVSLRIPDMQRNESRAFGETDLNYLANCSLQMVIFDGEGYLREVLNPLAADAAAGSIGISNITEDVTNGEIDFNVTLSEAVNKRIIHFIVNSPTTSYEFGDEATLISSLSVALNDDGSGNDVYWQRVEFPNGIDNSDVTKVLMNRIPMIRNFAKITVTNNAEDFTYQGFSVVNVWNKGTVAPYKGEGLFANLNNNETMQSYEYITTTEKYEGIWPADAELVNSNPSDVSDKTIQTAPFYMYERRNTYVSADIPATYLLVYGTYGYKNYWYKLDLVYDVDAEGAMVTSEEQVASGKQYYNILRNFHYAISIDEVTGAGYESPEDAAAHAASNNLSGSIDIRDLTNISDAINRLFVSYTDTTLVDNGTITVRYKYVPSSSTDAKNNDDVTITELTGGTEEDCMTSFTKSESNDDDGWRSVSVTFEDIPTDWKVITNTLRFSIDGLSREVDFNLRKKMYMLVECDPMIIPTGTERKVAANILIPIDITGAEDPYQFFPIEFLVEAEQMTLSPDVVSNKAGITLSPYEMPVVLGTSIVPGSNKQTFRYKRTVNNEEYQSLPTKAVSVVYNGETITGTYKVIPCNFLTNTEISATAVYAQNEYFTLIKEGEFENIIPAISNVELVGEQYYGIGKTVTLNITVNEPGTYQVTFAETGTDGGTATIEVAEGQTTGSVTYPTQSWNGAISATVTSEENETFAITGETRNVLKFGAISANDNAPNDDTTLNVYSSNGTNVGTINYTQLTAGTAEIVDKSNVWANISDPINGNLCYFTYTQGGKNNRKTYKSDTLSIPQAMNSGNSFNFSQQ